MGLNLTRREREVLVELTRGYSAVEIAARQHLALTTIRSQIQAVLHKLGVHSQIAAVAIARQSGLSWSTEPRPEHRPVPDPGT